MTAPTSPHAEQERALRAVLAEAYELLLTIAKKKAAMGDTAAEEAKRDADARSSDEF